MKKHNHIVNQFYWIMYCQYCILHTFLFKVESSKINQKTFHRTILPISQFNCSWRAVHQQSRMESADVNFNFPLRLKAALTNLSLCCSAIYHTSPGHSGNIKRSQGFQLQTFTLRNHSIDVHVKRHPWKTLPPSERASFCSDFDAKNTRLCSYKIRSLCIKSSQK